MDTETQPWRQTKIVPMGRICFNGKHIRTRIRIRDTQTNKRRPLLNDPHDRRIGEVTARRSKRIFSPVHTCARLFPKIKVGCAPTTLPRTGIPATHLTKSNVLFLTYDGRLHTVSVNERQLLTSKGSALGQNMHQLLKVMTRQLDYWQYAERQLSLNAKSAHTRTSITKITYRGEVRCSKVHGWDPRMIL